MILAKRAADIYEVLQLPKFITWPFLFAAACLIVVIWSIVRIISRVNEDVDPAVSDQEMLNSISEMRREGDLTEDEYRSIKSQLVGRLGSTFQRPNQNHQSKAKVEQTSAEKSKILSQVSENETESKRASPPEESESMQPTTSSSLTEVPTPHRDTADKNTKSGAPDTETGEGN